MVFYLQLVCTNKNKDTFAKIEGRKDGIYYAKKSGAIDKAKDEIVTKGELEELRTLVQTLQAKVNELEGKLAGQ